MELITNGVVIGDALKFVKEHKNNIKINEIDLNQNMKLQQKPFSN